MATSLMWEPAGPGPDRASLLPRRRVGPRRLPVCGRVRPFPALHALLRALGFDRCVLYPSPPRLHSCRLCLEASVYVAHVFLRLFPYCFNIHRDLLPRASAVKVTMRPLQLWVFRVPSALTLRFAVTGSLWYFLLSLCHR